MKQNWKHLEPFRVRDGQRPTLTGNRFGQFIFPLENANLCIIAFDGADPEARDDILRDAGAEAIGWEHVSVHAREIGRILIGGRPSSTKRTPTWEEMCTVKGLFWEDEDCVLQFHPPRSEYVNTNPHVLHLWRNAGITVQLPPKCLV